MLLEPLQQFIDETIYSFLQVLQFIVIELKMDFQMDGGK